MSAVYDRERADASIDLPVYRVAFMDTHPNLSFSGFLAIGSANFAYYRLMGVPSDLIFRAPYTVDNTTRFFATSKAARDDFRCAMRIDYHQSL